MVHGCIPSVYMFGVGDRINVDGAVGTIRYIGAIPQWDDTVALGIEWDDPKRGKNSGDINGTYFFRTTVAGAGSFLKASNKKIFPSVTFVEAVALKYSEKSLVSLVFPLSIGSKQVETFGFDRWSREHQQLGHVDAIGLERLNICSAGDMSVFPKLAGLTYLDLSSNLFTDGAEIAAIVAWCPQLRSLNLNGNKIRSWLSDKVFPTIEELLLADTGIGSGVDLARVFPNVKQLCLAHCGLTEDHLSLISLPGEIVEIDLSYNCLRKIVVPGISIHTLNVSHNPICGENILVAIQPQIRSLDLRYSDIGEWQYVEKIWEVFPNVENLRINGCPLLTDLSIDDAMTCLMGFLQCGRGVGITLLNGSSLSEEEITNGELYFISMVKKGKVLAPSRRRWQQLLKKHGINQAQTEPEHLQGKSVKLNFSGEQSLSGLHFSREFLRKSSVLFVRGFVASKMQASVLHVRLYYYVNSVPHMEKCYLEDDIASLDSIGLSSNQTIHVHLLNPED